MAKKHQLDPEQIKSDAVQLGSTLAEQAHAAAEKVADLAEQGLDWAGPRAQEVLDNARKTADSARKSAQPYIDEATDRARDAADKVRPVVEEARKRAEDDYLPRVNRAWTEATAAAQTDGDLIERARRAADAGSYALTTPTPKRKSHRVAKCFGWTALGLSAAGVGYLLWRRSQPIEDPWAEEYWADLDTDVELPDVEVESADDAQGASQTPTDEKKAAAEEAAQAKLEADEKANKEAEEAAK